MKFFLDTANVEEIKRISALGLVDVVTTNPTIITKEGHPFEEVIKEICSFIESFLKDWKYQALENEGEKYATV
jgi:transaldolase